jgi:hypothetical protein
MGFILFGGQASKLLQYHHSSLFVKQCTSTILYCWRLGDVFPFISYLLLMQVKYAGYLRFCRPMPGVACAIAVLTNCVLVAHFSSERRRRRKGEGNWKNIFVGAPATWAGKLDGDGRRSTVRCLTAVGLLIACFEAHQLSTSPGSWQWWSLLFWSKSWLFSWGYYSSSLNRMLCPPPPSFLYVVCKSINRHVPVFFLKNKNKRHASSFWMLFVGL